MRAPFPSSRLEVLTPDDQMWVCFGIFVTYGEDGRAINASIEPPPPEGSRIVHVDTRLVNGALVESIDVICIIEA